MPTPDGQWGCGARSYVKCPIGRPLAATDAAQDLRTCSVCHRLVARERCHKNRYGNYICHACMNAKPSGSSKAGRRNASSQFMRQLVLGLSIALVLLVVVVFVRLLNK